MSTRYNSVIYYIVVKMYDALYCVCRDGTRVYELRFYKRLVFVAQYECHLHGRRESVRIEDAFLFA